MLYLCTANALEHNKKTIVWCFTINQIAGLLQFDIIMLDVAAPDPEGGPGSLHSVLSHFLSPENVQEGLQRRLR